MNEPELKYSPKHRAFFLLMTDNRHSSIARAAGFAFHKKVKHWFTYDVQKASKLIKYASPKTLRRLEGIAHRLQLSHATGHEDFCKEIVLRDPPDDLEYKPYQRVGIHCIKNQAVTLLADEQGLGKTIQGIGGWSEIRPKTCLVVCPASVKLNWAREFHLWTHEKPKIHVQQGRKNFPLNRPPVVIINYDVLDALHEELTDKPWDMVIVDEMQALKNTKAKRTQATLGYRQKPGILRGAKNIVLMSGTPVPNRPIEFFPCLTRLAPDVIFPFTKYFDYGRRFCNGYQGPFGWDMTGSSNEDELNIRLRSTIMIRRLKADVIKDLPDKQYQIIPMETDTKTARLVKKESKLVDWDDLKKTGLPKGAEIGELAEIRHELAKAKTPACLAHVKEMLEGDVDKIVVFAYHRAVIDMLMDGLKDYCPVKLDGSMTAVKKQQSVDLFQKNPDCRVFVGQINAAGVGITLTAASNVVFIESTWVPGDIAQAVDRCHRIGQKNSVLAQFLVTRGSLEEYMLKSVVDKQHSINRIVN